ncbi:MAG: ribose transport system ATP-binding protein [Solirubrobacteraceae bacterium]|jgi:ABC-type sugar transport system ATPase subunit|nr:ribose transport system ATP-binding protein [Solirubrobacteraceae bacterium]
MTPAGRYALEHGHHDYAGVPALTDVSLELRGGEVHGLVGENGSGKSTLIRILSGAVRPRAGRLVLDGEEIGLASPRSAVERGIGVVHQDYHLFADMTVAQNILGVNAAPPRRRFTRTVDRRAVERTVEALLSRLGIEIAGTRLVRSLGPAERKFVEIARAMLIEPRFLVLDEPTASLEPSAAERVLTLLRRLRAQDVGLLFVSHRLDEVLRIGDRVTTLRDGRRVSCLPATALDEDRLAHLITGGVAKVDVHRRPRPPAEGRAIEVSGLRLVAGRQPISFNVDRGEIFGLTGLLGSGAERVVRMLGGAEPLRGTLKVDGVPRRLRTPRDAQRLRIGFIPEDRKAAGLIADQSIAMNVSLASLHTVSRAGVLRHRDIRERAERYRAELRIKAPSVRAPVSTLSGGNQQKVMLAKWLASGVRILVVEEPTHGIDIGGKAQVHDLLRRFAAGGGTVVVASTDVGEVLDLCHRVGVMRHGGLTHLLSAHELTSARVTALGAREPEHVLESLIETPTPAPPA